MEINIVGTEEENTLKKRQSLNLLNKQQEK